MSADHTICDGRSREKRSASRQIDTNPNTTANPGRASLLRATLLCSAKFAIFSFAILCANVFSQDAPAEARKLATFLIDSRLHEGMFYSVHDFCGPKTTPLVAQLTRDVWTRENERFHSVRPFAERRYFQLVAEYASLEEAKEKLSEAMTKAFESTRQSDRLAKDLFGAPDLVELCAKRLGTLSGHGMSFEIIAPESYKFWQSNLKSQ